MAISNGLGLSTGTFAPAFSRSNEDRSEVIHGGTRVTYKIDLDFHKINMTDHIKWCRRNLGERGREWDFWLAGGLLYVEVWDDKAKFAYEMWKN